MMNLLNKTRLSAILIHLGISCVIAVLSIGLVYGLWYPSGLSTALGLDQVFLMLLGIDVCLGPLLTSVIYNPKKASLKKDLIVIMCIQMIALGYGLYTVGSKRPVYMVFTKDRFDLVTANNVGIGIKGDSPVLITDKNTPNNPETPKVKANIILQNPWTQPLFGYQLAYADIPRIPEHFNLLQTITMSALSGGPDIPNLINFHQPYLNALPKIKETTFAFDKVPKLNEPKIKADIDHLKAKYPTHSHVTPLKIEFTIYTVVLDPKTGEIFGIEPVDVF